MSRGFNLTDDLKKNCDLQTSGVLTLFFEFYELRRIFQKG